MFKNLVFEKKFLAHWRNTMEKVKKLELLPAPVKTKAGKMEEGILNVVKRSITLSADEYKKPQEWVGQISQMIENTFACKIECVAATPPIVTSVSTWVFPDHNFAIRKIA